MFKLQLWNVTRDVNQHDIKHCVLDMHHLCYSGTRNIFMKDTKIRILTLENKITWKKIQPLSETTIFVGDRHIGSQKFAMVVLAVACGVMTISQA